MDPLVIDRLTRAGFDLDDEAPPIHVQLGTGEIPPRGDCVPVAQGDARATLTLQPISSLWRGDRAAPDLSGRPPDEYVTFFAAIERPAAAYCLARGRPLIDKEFERLYELLRRRPDGRDAEPAFQVLRAGARLHLSLHDVSRDEFEAVARRLARSARTFAMGLVSRNYWEHALMPLCDVPD